MVRIEDQARPALARGTRLTTDKVTGQPILLYPEGVVHLSEHAQEIVRRCDGKSSVQSIVRGLAEEFEAAESEIRRDVADALADLVGRKLIILG
jgi:coenzyme PQQ biosynthesis protein PqqD